MLSGVLPLCRDGEAGSCLVMGVGVGKWIWVLVVLVVVLGGE